MSKFNLSTFIAGIIASLAITLGVSFLKPAQKIVYVDTVKILNGYKGMQEARKVYQGKVAQWKANVDTLATELNNQVQHYERDKNKMTVKEKAVTQELLKQKQNSLLQYQQALNTQAEQEDRAMTTEVLTTVNAFLKKYGKQQGYPIILAATQTGNIAYAEEHLDVTEEVLKGLNSEYTPK